MPSTMIRGTGVLLVIIGLSGAIGGIYALKVVHDYDFVSVGTAGVETSISDMSASLEQNKQDVDSALSNTTSSLNTTSKSLADTGTRMGSTSEKLESSSIHLNESAKQLEGASSLNEEAGEDLYDAYEKLTEWSDDYSSNGSPLPQKSTFDAGTLKIKEASRKLEVMGDKLKSSSESLEKSANDLNEASLDMDRSSETLKTAGEDLTKSSESLEKFKSPLVGMLTDVSTPLKDLNSNIESISNIGSNLQTGAYALIGYTILLHIILLFIGVALIVIDVNLFYPV